MYPVYSATEFSTPARRLRTSFIECYGWLPALLNSVAHRIDRAIRAGQSTPRYIISDKGEQFWCRSYKRWCKRRGIRPRYGRIGGPASMAIVERCIRSMKQECTRHLLIPTSLAGMRRELRLYMAWYNTARPHTALARKTPQETDSGRTSRRLRFEPRPKWPHRRHRRGVGGDQFGLAVSYIEGRKHLPTVGKLFK